MTRARRAEALGAVLLTAVVVLVVVLTLRPSSSSSAAHPTTSARPAAIAFARSYLAFLSGTGSARALPDTTDHVRSIAAGGGTLPPRDRSPALRFTGLRLSAVTGAPHGTAVLAGANPHVSLRAALGLAYVDGHWTVASLVPPDLDTLLAHSPAPAVPPALRRAARAAVLAYADYREHAGARPRGLAAPAAHQLAAGSDPLAHVHATGRPARLSRLALVPQGKLASVSATLADGPRRLHVELVMRRTGAGWQAWSFLERQS